MTNEAKDMSDDTENEFTGDEPAERLKRPLSAPTIPSTARA